MQARESSGRQAGSSGEPMVWTTAMGLAVGSVMVVSLLVLILLNGITAFWPKRVVYLELAGESRARLGDSPVLAGEVVKRQAKTASAAAQGEQIEWQLFVGNKERYGLSFRYVDVTDIVVQRFPEQAMSIERLEYGDAIGEPLALRIQGEAELASDGPEFRGRLQGLVHEVKTRRQEIKRLERSAIGAINARMMRLREQKRTLEREGVPQGDAAYLNIQEAMAPLQARYENLAAEARELRRLQNENQLVYRIASGDEVVLPLGQIVGYHFPNQLGFWGRLGLFAHNMWAFLTQEPREANTEGGVFPAIFGTFVMTVLMSMAVTPFGVLAAMYLREYAKQGFVVRTVRIAVNNLAGVPSIVFGVFGLGFFVYFVGGSIDEFFFHHALPTPTFGTGGIIWASLTLALMTVPVVIVATEEALSAVPRGMREGSMACGASKWQTMQRIVLPASAPGILTGLILAMARGAGEVAPLMLVGVVKLAPTLPVDGIFPFVHLDRKFMHLGFHIFDLGFQSPDSEAAKPMVFATTLLLIALVMVLNIGAIWIRDRLRRKYATGAF